MMMIELNKIFCRYNIYAFLRGKVFALNKVITQIDFRSVKAYLPVEAPSYNLVL